MLFLSCTGHVVGQRHSRQRERRSGRDQGDWGWCRERLSSEHGAPEWCSWRKNCYAGGWTSRWNCWPGAKVKTHTLPVSCFTTLLIHLSCLSAVCFFLLMCAFISQSVRCWGSDEDHRSLNQTTDSGSPQSWCKQYWPDKGCVCCLLWSVKDGCQCPKLVVVFWQL